MSLVLSLLGAMSARISLADESVIAKRRSEFLFFSKTTFLILCGAPSSIVNTPQSLLIIMKTSALYETTPFEFTELPNAHGALRTSLGFAPFTPRS